MRTTAASALTRPQPSTEDRGKLGRSCGRAGTWSDGDCGRAAVAEPNSGFHLHGGRYVHFRFSLDLASSSPTARTAPV